MPELIQPLATVLMAVEDFPWNHALYLDSERPWTATTRCSVLDPDDVDEPESDDVPEFAAVNGLVYALLLTQVQDIVDNARQQLDSVTASDLVRAFNYYYEHDAFIKF